MPPFNEDQHIYRRAILQDRCNNLKQQQQQQQQQPHQSEWSRTQHKLQLQRLSFLTNDKNYLDHPQNMKRLTKELDRVNREYRNVRRFEDPVKESLKRLVASKSSQSASIPLLRSDQQQQKQRLVRSNSSGSSSSSDKSSSGSSSLSSSTADVTLTPYSTSAEKSSFLTRWFISNEETLPIVSKHDSTTTAEQCNSVVYSFHPTIASQMKRKNKK
ncbi:unnamed protein product [Mucor circinelloides]|uniref:Uncharacterized protein n=1 Tax=Mucor circinelloides f. circinelloides (strain 1006PhL) TaxID=1220926 RepID=S2IY54_MUCC1|nr:hypothetical protein HMPREF1544_11082 [Mucor circinelloides 1006PhL]